MNFCWTKWTILMCRSCCKCCKYLSFHFYWCTLIKYLSYWLKICCFKITTISSFPDHITSFIISYYIIISKIKIKWINNKWYRPLLYGFLSNLNVLYSFIRISIFYCYFINTGDFHEPISGIEPIIIIRSFFTKLWLSFNFIVL